MPIPCTAHTRPDMVTARPGGIAMQQRGTSITCWLAEALTRHSVICHAWITSVLLTRCTQAEEDVERESTSSGHTLVGKDHSPSLKSSRLARQTSTADRRSDEATAPSHTAIEAGQTIHGTVKGAADVQENLKEKQRQQAKDAAEAFRDLQVCKKSQVNMLVLRCASPDTQTLPRSKLSRRTSA